MARRINRLHPHGSKYERKTDWKHGQEVVKPLKKEDFDEMVRLCTVRRDAAAPGSGEYYRWYRNYVILIVGVNTGNRIGVICEQTARDYAGGQYTVTEHKTGKRKQMELNPEVYKIVSGYCEEFGFKNNAYIFRPYRNRDIPMTREGVWHMIKNLAEDAGVKYCVGAHSLRKSFGRWIYDETHDIHMVQRLLDHESTIVTQRYIGLEEESVQVKRESVNFVPKYM